jgi:tetratricopeptide (TPR) repeat protein
MQQKSPPPYAGQSPAPQQSSQYLQSSFSLHLPGPPVSAKTKAQWFCEVMAHYNAGHYEQALADYEEVLRLDPTYAGVYYNRGNVYYALRQYDQALEDYEQALKLDPTHSEAQKWRQEASRTFSNRL